MYLNHPLVPGFPLTLRYGEERDRVFLADVFAEVWAEIPESDRAAILARGYGQSHRRCPGKTSGFGGSWIWAVIFSSPRRNRYLPHNVVAGMVAREFAHEVDDFFHPNPVARLKEPRQDAKRRVVRSFSGGAFRPGQSRSIPQADQEQIRASPERTARGLTLSPGSAPIAFDADVRYPGFWVGSVIVWRLRFYVQGFLIRAWWSRLRRRNGVFR